MTWHVQYNGGDLSFEYRISGGACYFTKCTYTLDDTIRQIALRNIWINEIPASELESFRYRYLSEEIIGECVLDDGVLSLTTQNQDWTWYCSEVQLIAVYLSYKDHIWEYSIPQSLRIMGVKKIIRNQLPGSDPHITRVNGRYLSDSLTLEQSGIASGDTLNILNKIDLVAPGSSLQKATGSEYESVAFFEEWATRLQEATGIVCVIKHKHKSLFGTGFLIGPQLVITNMHLFRSIEHGLPVNELSSDYQAHFFYNEQNGSSVIVDLEEILCSSEPGLPPFEEPHVDHLDFAVVKFTPPPLFSFNWRGAWQLKCEGERGDLLFQDAKENSLDFKLNRANIIQHPQMVLDNNYVSPSPKQIAFRENLIHGIPTIYSIHYSTKTSNASSGSPVINDVGQWIGLHVSECNEINQKLFTFIDELIEELGGGLNEREDEYGHYAIVRGNEIIRIFFSGLNKARCIRETEDGVSRPFSLLVLIQIVKDFQNQLESAEWAIGFLRRIEPDFLVGQEHAYCNTAIRSSKIIESMREDDFRNFEAQKPTFTTSQIKMGSFFLIGGAVVGWYAYKKFNE